MESSNVVEFNTLEVVFRNWDISISGIVFLTPFVLLIKERSTVLCGRYRDLHSVAIEKYTTGFNFSQPLVAFTLKAV